MGGHTNLDNSHAWQVRSPALVDYLKVRFAVQFAGKPRKASIYVSYESQLS